MCKPKVTMLYWHVFDKGMFLVARARRASPAVLAPASKERSEYRFFPLIPSQDGKRPVLVVQSVNPSVPDHPS